MTLVSQKELGICNIPHDEMTDGIYYIPFVISSCMICYIIIIIVTIVSTNAWQRCGSDHHPKCVRTQTND